MLPYGSELMVKKIECRNHLLRNYAMKLNALAKITKYPIIIRKFITSNILRFRSDITKAIGYHKRRNLTLHQTILGLCLFYFILYY